MANIDIKNISNLDINGNNLFEDSESFMTELSEDDKIEAIKGGKGCVLPSCAEITDVCVRNTGIIVEMLFNI